MPGAEAGSGGFGLRFLTISDRSFLQSVPGAEAGGGGHEPAQEEQLELLLVFQ